jgi:hypothetical protein
MRCRRSRRSRACRWLLVATALLGCDASGSMEGGTPIVADPCSAPDLGHTWTDLYTCYFGPGGKTSCVGQGLCHGGPDQTGALFPNSWVCGTTRESCWRGMTQGQQACSDAGQGAEGGDGGTVEAGAPMCMASSQPIVQADGGGTDPTTTLLWHALRGASGVGLHNMPYSPPATAGVTFTQQDLDRISAWIREGAQDN